MFVSVMNVILARSIVASVVATATLLRIAGFCCAEDLSGVPAKIYVMSASEERPGSLKIELLDPANHPAPAKKDLQVQVETKAENGSVDKSTVTIKQGQTGTSTDIPVKNVGIVEVTASNPGLAEGGAVVNVQRSEYPAEGPSPTAAPIATVAPIAPSGGRKEVPEATPATAEKSNRYDRAQRENNAPQEEMALPGGTNNIGSSDSKEKMRAWTSTGAFQKSLSSVSSITGRISDVSDSVKSIAPTRAPTLKLRYYPARKLRADENDPATVWAALPGNEPAVIDFEVYLMSDLGPLTPEPIKIPKGDVIGQAKLVATRPGAIQVWYQYSKPPATAPDPPLTITFTHPVWAPRLVPTERTVGLFDSVDVAVELVNYQGTSVPADEERPVYIAIQTGAGELSSTAVKFAPEDSRAMTKFIPTRPGKIRLVATSPYLPERYADLDVTTPYGLLGLCAFGGFVGGLLAYWTEKSSASKQRIWIGLITGFILYWAFLFGIVHAPNVPHAFLLNPFSAIILPLLGGWGGTKVITLILKPLGLSW